METIGEWTKNNWIGMHKFSVAEMECAMVCQVTENEASSLISCPPPNVRL
jgi:hypothetical protein